MIPVVLSDDPPGVQEIQDIVAGTLRSAGSVWQDKTGGVHCSVHSRAMTAGPDADHAQHVAGFLLRLARKCIAAAEEIIRTERGDKLGRLAREAIGRMSRPAQPSANRNKAR